MSLSPNADPLQEVLPLHRRGAVAEAAARYAAMPRADPNNVDANLLFGPNSLPAGPL